MRVKVVSRARDDQDPGIVPAIAKQMLEHHFRHASVLQYHVSCWNGSLTCSSRYQTKRDSAIITSLQAAFLHPSSCNVVIGDTKLEVSRW